MHAFLIGLVGIVLTVSASKATEEYEKHWCGKLLSTPECAQEVTRIEKKLKDFDDYERRVGRMIYNRGSSLVGCSLYCAQRHVEYDEHKNSPNKLCSYSTKALKRFEAGDRRLSRARVIENITYRCSPILGAGVVQPKGCSLDGRRLIAKGGDPKFDGKLFQIKKVMSQFWRIKSPSYNDGKADGFVRMSIEGEAGRFYISERYSGWGMPQDIGFSEILTPKNDRQVDPTKRDRRGERARVNGIFHIFEGPLEGVSLYPLGCQIPDDVCIKDEGSCQAFEKIKVEGIASADLVKRVASFQPISGPELLANWRRHIGERVHIAYCALRPTTSQTIPCAIFDGAKEIGIAELPIDELSAKDADWYRSTCMEDKPKVACTVEVKGRIASAGDQPRITGAELIY